MMNIEFIKLSENAVMPCYGRVGDAGLDLFTAEDVMIKAGCTVAIPTDIAIQLPIGYEAQVRPRSGHSLNGVKGCKEIGYAEKYKMEKLENGYVEGRFVEEPYEYDCQPYLRVQLGTIDSNYRGNIGIITYNQEHYDVLVPKGTKLAQLVIAPVATIRLIEVDELNKTERGEKGFGSSGN